MNVLKKISILFLSAVLSLLTAACNASGPETAAVSSGSVTITLTAVGDMLMHAGVSSRALTADGSYCYDYLFEHTKDAISSADLAVVNNEVIFGGNEIGNVGYPLFNVRTELGDAEVKAGFDVILGATNHSLDQHIDGIFHTVSFWKEQYPDILLLGLHDSQAAAQNLTVINCRGIRIAMLNYTYGLNGLKLPDGYEYAVDRMDDSAKVKISNDIARARKQADFVIVFPHWGTEYNLGISDDQLEWASFFSEQGVDLVIGSHPHVVEPVEWVNDRTLVYYSLGNYVSIQYYIFSMLGAMATVRITKNDNGTFISGYDLDYLVTHYDSDRSHVTTYFLEEYTDALAASHAILTEPPDKYQTVNASYTFSLNGLKKLAAAINPGFVDTE